MFLDNGFKLCSNISQHRTLYLPNEVLLMLQVAGFRQVTIRGDHTDTPATPDSRELVFTALR